MQAAACRPDFILFFVVQWTAAALFGFPGVPLAQLPDRRQARLFHETLQALEEPLQAVQQTHNRRVAAVACDQSVHGAPKLYILHVALRVLLKPDDEIEYVLRRERNALFQQQHLHQPKRVVRGMQHSTAAAAAATAAASTV